MNNNARADDDVMHTRISPDVGDVRGERFAYIEDAVCITSPGHTSETNLRMYGRMHVYRGGGCYSIETFPNHSPCICGNVFHM